MNKVAVSGVVAVLVLGAGYLGATAWSGTQAQSRYHDQIARAQARLPFMRVSEEKYQKGFFTSTSTTTLQFGCPTAADPQAATATVTSTIHHGPLAGGTLAAAVIDSQLRIAGAQIQPVVDAFAGVPLTIRTVVGYTGSAHSTFDSPAAKMPIGTGGEVAWQGLSGTLETGKDARAASYRFRSPGLTLTDPKTHATVRLAGLALEGDGKATNDTGLITVGKVQGTLDSMDIGDGSGNDSARLVLTALKLNSNTWIDGDLLAGTGTFSGAGSFGDAKIDHFEMQTSLQRWHAPTYQHLMETATKEIYRCDSQDKMADLLGLQDKMKDDLVAMLRYNPELSLDKLVVQSGGLSGELSYSVGVDGVTEADARLPRDRPDDGARPGPGSGSFSGRVAAQDDDDGHGAAARQGGRPGNVRHDAGAGASAGLPRARQRLREDEDGIRGRRAEGQRQAARAWSGRAGRQCRAHAGSAPSPVERLSPRPARPCGRPRSPAPAPGEIRRPARRCPSGRRARRSRTSSSRCRRPSFRRSSSRSARLAWRR